MGTVLLCAARPSALLFPLFAVLVGGGCQREQTSTPPETPTRPRLVLSKDSLDLGDANIGETRSCAVRVSNDGTAPLALELESKSCKCGEVVLPNRDIPPGGKETLTVRWTPPPGETGSILLVVKLKTNDPDHPLYRLELTGRVNPLVFLLPPNRSTIDFQTIPPAPGAERALKLVSTRLPAFDLEATTTHDGLKVEVTKLPPGDEVDGFRSGYAVRVRTTEQLGIGSFRETLALKITLPDGKAWTMPVPVFGEVENRLFEVSPREVRFSKASILEQDEKRVMVQFLGSSKDEDLQVERCEPSFLACDPPRQLRPGRWEITIRLPAENATAAKYQADGSFEGRLLLRTSVSPSAVAVPVRWSGTAGTSRDR